MPLQIAVRDTGDLKRLARDLRDVGDGGELRKELTRGLRGVLNPIRGQVQAAYRAAPSRGGRRPGPGLRSLLAKATRVEVRTSGRLAGARIRVDGRKMPPGQRSLPKYWEGEKRPWRWPVYGDRENWAQGTARPTFYRTVQPHEPQALQAVDEVLDGVRRKLERGHL